MQSGDAGCNQSTRLYLQARRVPQLCAWGFSEAHGRCARFPRNVTFFIPWHYEKSTSYNMDFFFFFKTESREKAAAEGEEESEPRGVR